MIINSGVSKLIIISGIVLSLTGCAASFDKPSAQPDIIVQKPEVVTPDTALFNCPVVTQLPNPDTLKDSQVSALVTKLWKNNLQCRNSIVALKKYLVKAKEIIKNNVKTDKYGDIY